MNGYLSRIAARAAGITDRAPINKSNTIKPIIHTWPPQVNPDNSNLFEGEVGPEPTQTTQILPDTHTLPDTIIDKQADLKHSPLHTDKREKVQKQIKIAPVKPGVVETVLKNPGNKEKSLFETGDETPINPVSTTKRIIHSQVFTQRIESKDNKRSMKEPVPREADNPALETVRQSTVEPAVSGLSPTGSKDSNSKPITGSVNVPVPELRPVSANADNPAIFTPLKKENKGPRLVIGRIKVEVVTPQPVKNQPAKIRTVTRVKESRPARDGLHSKMQFGLGQI
jgi:hypothetical protein